MVTNRTWIALGIYLVYNAIIFATWAAVGADYTNMVGELVVFKSIVLPLALGAIFTAVTVTYLKWWRATCFDTTPAGPRWAALLVIIVMAGFLAVHLSAIGWQKLSATHLIMLITAGILVGFNEEMVTRGILVHGLRGSTSNEAWIWFGSSALFGLMHVPNAFFGIGLAGGLIQCVFAFLMGGAFYVLRRVTGTIFLPMALHGAWDFVSFSSQASGASPSLSPVFQFGTYLAAVIAVVAVLLHGRRNRAGTSGA